MTPELRKNKLLLNEWVNNHHKEICWNYNVGTKIILSNKELTRWHDSQSFPLICDPWNKVRSSNPWPVILRENQISDWSGEADPTSWIPTIPHETEGRVWYVVGSNKCGLTSQTNYIWFSFYAMVFGWFITVLFTELYCTMR